MHHLLRPTLSALVLAACGTAPSPPAAPVAPPVAEPTGVWTTADDAFGVYGSWTFAPDGTAAWQTGEAHCRDGVVRREGTWTRVGGDVAVTWVRESRAVGAVPTEQGCDRSGERIGIALIDWTQDLGRSPCSPASAACAMWLNRPWQREAP